MKPKPVPTSETLPANTAAGRILIVGGIPEVRVKLVEHLRGDGHTCTHVADSDAARSAHRRRRFDLLIVHADINGALPFIGELRNDPRIVRSIVYADAISATTTISAIRAGASDVLDLSEEASDVISKRIRTAIACGAEERQKRRRIRKLQRICKDLSSARAKISDQVDLLCDDMLEAYRSLTERVDDMVIASEFRTLIRQELDVEDLLRTSLQYLLTRTGPTNAAVFLPDENGRYNLGAYVNCDCPRDSVDPVLEHMAHVICPRLNDESDIVAFDDARAFSRWIGAEESAFAQSHVLAFACQHDDRTMAVMVLFRNAQTPFPPEMAGTLDTLRSLFAEQLHRVTVVHHRAQPQWPAEPDDLFDDEFGEDLGFGGMAA